MPTDEETEPKQENGRPVATASIAEATSLSNGKGLILNMEPRTFIGRLSRRCVRAVGLAWVMALASLGAARAQPVIATPTPVILDTDMWGDIDDMLALAGLHALQDRGEAKILAITSSTADKWCASYIDVLDTFYGHANIPVGLVRNGVEPPARWSGDGRPMAADAQMYTQYVSNLRKPDGSFVFPRRLVDGAQAEDPVPLLRRTLAVQPDGSVVMIGIGFSTNFARLLDSRPDRYSALNGIELVKRKVKLLTAMAGRFADETYGGETLHKDRPEYNIRKDILSARHLFARWPTPIVLSGSEIGFTMRIKGSDIESKFNYVRNHPVVVTYRYMDRTYRTDTTANAALHDHKTFDLTAVLYAVRPNDGYFSLSRSGRLVVERTGLATLDEANGGNARYLIVNDAQRARVLEAMGLLASEPPRCPACGLHAQTRVKRKPS